MRNIFLFLLFITSLVYSSNIKDRVEEKLVSSNPDATLLFEKYNIDSELKSKIEKETNQKFFGDFVYLWKIIESDTLKKIILLDNVYGKTMPITFMIIFNKNGLIEKSEIVKYREEHGGEVSSSNWNNQFVGKDYSEPFKVGEDIDGITGATISVRSVTTGIKKLTLLVKIILDEDGS